MIKYCAYSYSRMSSAQTQAAALNAALTAAGKLSTQSAEVNVPPPTNPSIPQANVSGKCQSLYNTAFNLLEAKIKNQKSINVTNVEAGRVLRIHTGKRVFDVKVFEAPCFVERIPEMLTIYIVAQLLKIAEADEAVRDDVINQVELNINHKIVVLQQMNQHIRLNKP